jgi:hypothetical protein
VSSRWLRGEWAQATAWLPPILTRSNRPRAGQREGIQTVLSSIAYLSAVVLVIVVGLMVTVRLASFLWKYLRPPEEIYVDTVQWDGKDSDLADTVRERFRQWAEFRADADNSAEVLFAEDHLGRAQEKFQKLEVNIAGVPVTGVLGVLQKIVDPPYHLITIQGDTRGDTHYLLARLKVRGATQYEWRFLRSFDKEKSDDAKHALIDALVFRVLFDLGSQSQTASGGPNSLSFPNERALEAYANGSERLRAYLTSRRPADLERAISYLRIVNAEMPDSEQGLDLYALALTEDRQEAEATRVYSKLLGGDGPLTEAVVQKLDAAGRARKYQLELNRAQAYLFQYDVDSTNTAMEHLMALRGLIAANLARPDLSPADHAKLESLSAFTSAQLADVVGHLAAIVGHNRTVDRDFVNVLNAARGATGEPPLAGQKPGPALAEFAEAVSTTNAALLAQADTAHKAAAPYWNSASAHAQSEERALMRLVDSSRGYTMYLHARLTAADAKAFEDECKGAIHELENALAAQPDHYTVLQNLGRVYSDEALRASDPQFQTAILYFKRSAELKPNDYWAHSNLARLYGRRLENPATPKAELGTAREHIDKALTLRSNDAELYLISARVAMWEWEQAATSDRSSRQTTVEQLLQRGEHQGDQWDVQWAKAAWAVHGLRGFESSQTDIDAKKKEFKELQKAADKTLRAAMDYYDGHRTWAARQLKDRLEKLHDEIGATPYERRALITPIF